MYVCRLNGVYVGVSPKTLAAVGKMCSHGSARGHCILVANCVVDTFMPGVRQLQMVFLTLGRVLRRVHARVRNDHGFDIGHQVREMPVARSARDFHVTEGVGRYGVGIVID